MRQITDTVAATELQKPNLRILDAGCGTGYNLGHYGTGDSREVYGFDIAGAALEGARKRGFRKIAQASVTEIPFKPDTFDLVFSFDVVCQLPCERHDAALREMHRVLKPGGFLFIRVPAFMWLRSSHDDELKTFYRYKREELSSRLDRLGFMIEWTSYANGFLFPGDSAASIDQTSRNRQGDRREASPPWIGLAGSRSSEEYLSAKRNGSSRENGCRLDCLSSAMHVRNPLPLGEGRVRVSGFEPHCDPHPARLFVAAFGRSLRAALSQGERDYRKKLRTPSITRSTSPFDKYAWMGTLRTREHKRSACGHRAGLNSANAFWR